MSDDNDEYSGVIFDANVDIEENNYDCSFEDDEQEDLHSFITARSSSRESRLVNEFDILERIGKGGFGDVMKAKNKLDNRLYAIKKIPLDLENKKVNRKILREVKVLSRLNHTCVVRYYTAWTETSYDSEGCDDHEESEESLHDTDDVMSGESMRRIDSPEQDVNTDEEAASSEKELVKKNEVAVRKQYLYIQMEYCEKLTLRDCIDNNLYLDIDRRWTLFREIIEGLAHIHEQGIIHRDLKPVNIFMDSNDHVKIGDFGLATSGSLQKKNIGEEGIFVASDGEPCYDSIGDGYLTGQIGTELYTSPEIMTERTKYEYCQKVDMYSLGVIFFEMCCKPFETGMEKMKVIGDLRSIDIKLPDDFNQPEKESEALILRWLLSHDPDQRPNATDLLDSDHIPRQNELTRVISSITSDPQSKSYRQMIEAMFSQIVSLAGDQAYDRNIYKFGFSVKTSLLQSLVSDRLIGVFRRYGAVQLSTPLLMPQQQMYENVKSYPLLMDHSGRLVGLPYDLRVPFARYICNANIKNVKRYCIEKVYRRLKVGGFHPQERTDCVFDIVTSDSKSLQPDAEVLVLMQDIINEFPPLKRSGYAVTLKHTSIQKAVLLHFGIPEENIQAYKRFNLANLKLDEKSMSILHKFLRERGSLTHVRSMLQEIIKTGGKAGSLAKEGLREIYSVIRNAQGLGLTLPIFVQIGCIRRTDMFNGVTFKVTCGCHSKNVYTNLATGGRYDNLIQQFEQRQNIPAVPMSKTSGVGITLAFEKIVNAMKKHAEASAAYDILVCTEGEKPTVYMEMEKMRIVQLLWNAGFKTKIFHEASENQEKMQEFCRANGISYLVIVTKKLTTLEVYAIDKVKVRKEDDIYHSQLVTFFQQRLVQLPVCEQYPETSNRTSIVRQNKSSASDSDNVQQSNSVESNVTVTWNIVFKLQGRRLRSKDRRKHEASIKTVVQKSFPWLKVDCIEVIALDLLFFETKILTTYLEVDYSRDEFEASVNEVVEKLPEYRKCIEKVADHIGTLISGERFSCIVLYSIEDERARLLTRSAI